MGRYHNNVFKREGEKRGLILQKSGYIGWSVTTPSTELIHKIEELGLNKVFSNYRAGAANIQAGNNNGDDDTNVPKAGVRPKKKSYVRKYTCPVCGISCRATKDINIKCMDCDTQMIVMSN
jgi:hypothetical protein